MTRKRFLHPDRPVEVLHIVVKTTGKVKKDDAWSFDDEWRGKLLVQLHRFLKLYGGITALGLQCMSNHCHILLKIDHDFKRSRKEMAAAYFECYERKIHPNSSECYQLLKDQGNISKMMGRFARDFSYNYNRHLEVERDGHLWQKRFHSTEIEDTVGLLRCWVYILMNPVKAGMTLSPTADQFSSLTYEDQAWCEEMMQNFHALWQDFEDGHQTKSLEEFREMITGLLEEAVQAFLALSAEKQAQWKQEREFWKRAVAVGSPESLARCGASLPGKIHASASGDPLHWC